MTFGAEQYEVSYDGVTGQQQGDHCPEQLPSSGIHYSASTTKAVIPDLEEYSNYHITVTAKRGQESFVSSERVNVMTRSTGIIIYMYLHNV